MKRSEMVKLIQDAVYEKFQIKVRRKDIDPILTKIEQAGMVPPIIKEKSFYIAENGEEIYATHEWESEE